jgi:molybdopterin-binding protein
VFGAWSATILRNCLSCHQDLTAASWRDIVSAVAETVRTLAGEPRSLELSLAEHVCLALVAQGATHGWQLGTLLAPDGEIGRVWALSRPLTYRALDQLADKRLVRRAGSTRDGGRERQLLKVTAHGRRVAGTWLDAPVEHLREVRTELLLKLTLRERAGLDVEPLLREQQRHFEDRISSLTTGASPRDLVGLWRRESARAVRRFLAEAMRAPVDTDIGRPMMRISARNQLDATVVEITHGDVMSTVKTALPDGQTITAVITNESVADLDLARGDEVVIVVKSTEVMIAKP